MYFFFLSLLLCPSLHLGNFLVKIGCIVSLAVDFIGSFGSRKCVFWSQHMQIRHQMRNFASAILFPPPNHGWIIFFLMFFVFFARIHCLVLLHSRTPLVLFLLLLSFTCHVWDSICALTNSASANFTSFLYCLLLRLFYHELDCFTMKSEEKTQKRGGRTKD